MLSGMSADTILGIFLLPALVFAVGVLSHKMASPLGQGGTSGGFEGRNQPTPALRDRVESSQDSTFARPLPRRGLSKEKR